MRPEQPSENERTVCMKPSRTFW